MCVGVCVHRQGRRRTRVPERARVCVCTGARVCAYVCVRVHGLILPTLLYINPLTERACVRTCERIQDLAGA
jgi:hypothetical protein